MSAKPIHDQKGEPHERRRTRVVATARRRVTVDVDLLTRALVLIAEDIARTTDHHDD